MFVFVVLDGFTLQADFALVVLKGVALLCR